MSHYTVYKYISRLVAVLLVLMLLVGSFPMVLADGEGGSLGNDLSWSLSGGTLTITGTGEMTDISDPERAPWYELRDEIYRVVLPEGLTSIGNFAFYECEELQSVVIPDSVTRIGDFAFTYCKSLELLNLGSGVTSIGESTFSDCYRLTSLQLPGSLQSIGKKAFYRCETITTVTVPSGVTALGIAAFGYCKGLVSATVDANVTEIPSLLFYGCERLASVKLPDSVQKVGYHTFLDCALLHTVYYNGANQTPQAIEQAIGQDVPSFRDNGSVTAGSLQGSVSSGAVKEDGNGNAVFESTIVSPGEDNTVSVQIQHTDSGENAEGTTNTDITVTITGDSGWQEAINGVNEAIASSKEIADNNGSAFTTPHITVYVQGADPIDQSFIDNLAGRDVTVTVVTQDGSRWQIKGTDLDAQSQAKSYDLRYEVSPGSAQLCEELGTDRSFVLKFIAPATVNAEVMIRLDPALSLQNATLFQKSRGLTKIQSSVVDHDGYAHFYLASVSDKTDYYIAMNLPDVQQEAVVPEIIQAAYGSPEYVEPITYEITGRTSSWGLEIGQVTWILVAVLAGSFVVVGAVLFGLNKRKLKRGYIPDLDDHEEV